MSVARMTGSGTRRGCAVCFKPDATFRYGGVVKADAAQSRCFRCYTAEVHRHRDALKRLRRSITAARAPRAGVGAAAAGGSGALDVWGD